MTNKEEQNKQKFIDFLTRENIKFEDEGFGVSFSQEDMTDDQLNEFMTLMKETFEE